MSSISRSAEETHALGKAFGSTLAKGDVVAFFGDLGAGKTTFIRGLAEAVAGIDPRSVSSPTFTFLHVYDGLKTIYHFDLYRLPTEKEFLSSGFQDYFETDGICCIEWAEKIPSYLPSACYQVSISHAEEGTRKISMTRGCL